MACSISITRTTKALLRNIEYELSLFSYLVPVGNVVLRDQVAREGTQEGQGHTGRNPLPVGHRDQRLGEQVLISSVKLLNL